MSGKTRRVSRRVSRAKKTSKGLNILAILLLVNVVIIIIWLVMQYFGSMVVGSGRFNLVVATYSGDVVFVSFDKTEKAVRAVEYPGDLSIRSRSVGQYEISKLYELGKYEEERGDFVRRKIQGFMRVPVHGYVIAASKEGLQETIRGGLVSSVFRDSEANLNTLDSLILLFRSYSHVWYKDGEEELVREGVLVNRDGWSGYNNARLMAYVGENYFDWTVAEEGKQVAIIDVSGEDFLGQDVGDFVSNIGANVVVVRDLDEVREESSVLVDSRATQRSDTVNTMKSFLGIEVTEIADTAEYRAEIVIFIGRDMRSIF